MTTYKNFATATRSCLRLSSKRRLPSCATPTRRSPLALRWTVVTLAVLAMTGCAVSPVPITDADHKDRAQADASQLVAARVPVDGPLTLAQAMARAISFNLDYRVRQMEQAAATGQFELSKFDMLPKLTVSAGYSNRSNDSFGNGFDPSGNVSNNYTASVPREHSNSSATFSWNLLDFGLSYFRAKQLADQSLIAEERRRKAEQNLLQDVRLAYWRAYAAQQLLPEIDQLLTEVDGVAAKAKMVSAQRLMPPLQIVTFRRSLLDLQQQIVSRASDLMQWHQELANLLNLPVGVRYTLTGLDGVAVVRLKQFSDKVEALDAVALEFRPELREEGYRIRISDLEKTRAQLSAVLPGIGLDLGANHDSNKYLLNNAWTQVGMSASANLVKLFSLPSINRSADQQQQIDAARRIAQTSAVLAQIRIAVNRHAMLNQEYSFWAEAVNDDIQIVDAVLASAKVGGMETQFELVRAKARLLVTKVNAALAYANTEAAVGRIFNSVGLDMANNGALGADLPALSAALDDRLRRWEQDNFKTRPALVSPSVSFDLASKLPADGRSAISKAMTSTLAAADIKLVDEADLRFRTDISVTRLLDKSVSAVIKGQLMDRSNKVLAMFEQHSTLTDPVTPPQWAALGDAIAVRVSEAVRARAERPLLPLNQP